jgi:hypothetical protein
MTTPLLYFPDFEIGHYMIVFLKSYPNNKIEGHFTGFGYSSYNSSYDENKKLFTQGEVDPSVVIQEGPDGIFVDDKPIWFSDILRIYGLE